MSEETEESIWTEQRRKRINKLKNGIIVLWVAVAILPMLLGVGLLVRMRNLGTALEDISLQLDKLIWEKNEQRAMVEQLAEKLYALEERLAEREEPGADQEPAAPEDSTGQASAEQVNSPGTEPPKETMEITAAHKVYLTFDDGPSANTQKILDILDRYGVKATFFVLGKETEQDKEAMRQIVKNGHTLAMHSYSHRYEEIYGSEENFIRDFVKIRDYLYEVTGVECKIYRFPGGSSNSLSKLPMDRLAQYLDEQGVVFFDWNSSSGDGGAQLLPVETLLENSLKRIDQLDTFVILMHDSVSKPTTVEALPQLIESILDREDTVILPITEDTKPIQHIKWSPATPELPTEEGMEG